MTERNALPARLPPEILSHIISYLDSPHALYPLLTSSTQLYTIALRTLYRTIRQLPSPTAILLLRSLDTSHSTPRHTLLTSLTLDLRYSRPLRALPQLVHRVLLVLPKLTSFSLDLLPTNGALQAMLPHDAPFRLRTLRISAQIDAALSAFLEGQDDIVELTLLGWTSAPFALAPRALPRLRSFRTERSHILSEVITGRPVEFVSLSLSADGIYETLAALTRSTTPITRFTAVVVDSATSAPTSVTHLIPQIATCLPALESLSIITIVQNYDIGTMHASTPLLADFAQLRYLTFMASGEPEYELADEADVAADWGRACPTLRTIILPKGGVWFPRDGQWTSS
ncbi:hypothetical protein FA95DRAFT_1540264 [Auriscalpium vulgare]|uniref:Uncharacterized protein n=1 Tax=Auriscalpium vulgare TaxID=40419 RepID=A0ACB8RVT0_9AGAM|nr:hypothetical protein FA95DRAFT_1540264 [Auriscalpium vulgare]